MQMQWQNSVGPDKKEQSDSEQSGVYTAYPDQMVKEQSDWGLHYYPDLPV